MYKKTYTLTVMQRSDCLEYFLVNINGKLSKFAAHHNNKRYTTVAKNKRPSKTFFERLTCNIKYQ